MESIAGIKSKPTKEKVKSNEKQIKAEKYKDEPNADLDHPLRRSRNVLERTLSIAGERKARRADPRTLQGRSSTTRNSQEAPKMAQPNIPEACRGAPGTTQEIVQKVPENPKTRRSSDFHENLLFATH